MPTSPLYLGVAILHRRCCRGLVGRVVSGADYNYLVVDIVIVAYSYGAAYRDTRDNVPPLPRAS